MGRAPCCSKVGLHRGPWTPREDAFLTKYIQAHGEGQWRSLPKRAGLLRCGKSCRLRWMNYLRPDIKRGNITPEEDDLIIRMHSLLGNRWSLIAGRIPGRTDNEIKNYWNTHLSKKLRNKGTDPNTTNNKLTDPENKKKKKKKNKQKKDHKSTGKKVEESEKNSLIYLPKPIRVTSLLSSSIPRNDSSFTLESNASITSQEKLEQISSQEEEAKDGGVWGMQVVGKEDNEGENHDVGFGIGFFGEEDSDLANLNCDVEYCFPSTDHHHVHGSNGTLEKLYEEYLQLLKFEENPRELDSFAESLLA